MRIAIVITAKNESRLLRDNLLYHHATGIDKAFVYFDDTTDNGPQTLEDMPYVSSFTNVDYTQLTTAAHLTTILSKAKTHHTARQCLNWMHALEQSKKQNIDWLISIDADELVCANLDSVSSLKFLFQNVSLDTDGVSFETLEVLQNRLNFERVFEDARHFKKEEIRSKAYRKRFLKNIIDPITKHKLVSYMWYGHYIGKMAVRVNSKELIIPKNVHRFVYKDQSLIRSVKKGYLLHYHIYDFTDFKKKFRNFSNHATTFLSGNSIGALKSMCITVVNQRELSEYELQEFFKNNLMFSEKECKRLKGNWPWYYPFRRKNFICEVKSIGSVFSTMIKS